MGGLDRDDIEQALAELDGWSYDGSALTKTYEFADFVGAIGFMASVAPRIDELNHHPEWSNVYNRVDVRLSSHDVGAVTHRDFALASLLDSAAGGGYLPLAGE